MAKQRRRDHTELICNVSELGGLFTDSTSLETFLQRIVEMIAEHMQCEVCSVYLYHRDSEELVLEATKGLNVDFIGNVKLKLGEGLTGLALKEQRAICERNARKNANFRYFPGLGEEEYASFLAVPIIRGTIKVGVVVIQSTAKDYFTDEDIAAFRAITSQLANTIEMTRLILALEEKDDFEKKLSTEKDLTFIKGKAGSSGFAFAEAVILSDNKDLNAYLESSASQKYTLDDFLSAVEETEKELEQAQESIEEKLSDVASLIFTAQILMLKDKAFIDAIVALIKQGVNPPEAIVKVIEIYLKKFERISDAYLQEKRQDVRDIGKRLLENLIGEDEAFFNVHDRIVIARELVPSDALKLSSQDVKGIILLTGGATSHLSILAGSLQIPLIIADVPELLNLPQKTKVIMDAQQGNIYVNPKPDIIDSFKGRMDAHVKKPKSDISPETFTKDGTKIILLANINLLSDLKNAHEFKTEGIGLYRTEFPFVVRNDFPSEEEQFVIYKKLVDSMKGKEIMFRTLDIGGDKVLSYFEHHLKEKNPYLGMRSIRFSLQHVEIFSQQIRSILRAGVNADIRIMFPMISSIDEFQQAKEVVLDCIKDLKKEKMPCHMNPKIGLMIELPAVMEIIQELAKAADFFSIGTNDFIQYMLAVDRTNEKVADLYLPHHPSVLRALKKVVDTAKAHKKDVSVCGDMVHEPKYLSYLLGIGLRKMSLNPVHMPKVQTAIQKIDIKSAQKLTESILTKSQLTDTARLFDTNDTKR